VFLGCNFKKEDIMAEPVILREYDRLLKGVAKLTLNRPHVHNALDNQMIEELAQAFLEYGQDSSVRVILLASQGEVFSAGADLNWMKQAATKDLDQNISDAKKLAQLLDMIDQCPKPTIACVQGPTFGGGVGLVAACDIAVCTQVAFFCLSEVKWGLIPAIVSPYVIHAIGVRQARRYILTADRMSAEEALHLGLIHQVVGEGELEATTETLVASILKGSPEAIKASKELICFVKSHPLDEKLQEETARRIAVIRSSAEGQEGISAFLAKRTPAWAVPIKAK